MWHFIQLDVRPDWEERMRGPLDGRPAAFFKTSDWPPLRRLDWLTAHFRDPSQVEWSRSKHGVMLRVPLYPLNVPNGSANVFAAGAQWRQMLQSDKPVQAPNTLQEHFLFIGQENPPVTRQEGEHWLQRIWVGLVISELTPPS